MKVFYPNCQLKVNQETMAKLGDIYYQSAPGIKEHATIVVTESKNGTGALYQGQVYQTTIEWIAKALGNSGKKNTGRVVQIPDSTPRPSNNVPPTGRDSFGQFV